MDLAVRAISKGRSIHAASSVSNFLLDLSYSNNGHTVISVSRWDKNGGLSSALECPVGHWKSAAGERFSQHAVLDTAKHRIYASLVDERRFVSFPLTARSGDVLLEEGPQDFGFSSMLFDLVCLPADLETGKQNYIIAVSQTGELAIMCTCKGNTIQHKKLDSVMFDSVQALFTFSENYLMLVGMRTSHLTMVPLSFIGGETLDEVFFIPLWPVQLPDPPPLATAIASLKDNLVIDFNFDENFGTILYEDGSLHILRPGTSDFEMKENCFGSWTYSAGYGSHAEQAILSKLVHTFRLSPGIFEHTEDSIAIRQGQRRAFQGGIVRLGGSYIAVGYGHFVSVWDITYFVGHALAQLVGCVTEICPGFNDGTVLIGTDSGLLEAVVRNVDVSYPVSLGLAMTRKGKCDQIITKTQLIETIAPIRSQPVTVRATKTAAEAGGRVHRVFRGVIEALDTKELKIAKALMNRESYSSAEAVSQLTADYSAQNMHVRRGNRGERADMGLSKLPSERLASVSVARCLFEIHSGRTKFVVPLIDMLGTGVVSNEYVLSVVGQSDWGRECQPLSLFSVIDPLLDLDLYWNALEAVVTRISDLPEPDIVRIVQHIVQVTQEEFSREENQMCAGAEPETGVTLLSRGTHLLLQCISSAADRGRIIESLQQIPVADVIAVLTRLESILACRSSEEVERKTKIHRAPLSARQGIFSDSGTFEELGMYRGLGDWLDKDNANLYSHKYYTQIEACISWACHLIDAHVSNLIMDETGQEIAKRVLGMVRVRRREYIVMKRLQELSRHAAGRTVPHYLDAFYSCKLVHVPIYASLQ